MTAILFNSSFTYFYISIKYALGLDLVCDMLDTLVHMSTLIEDCGIDPYVLFFFVLFVGFQTWVDLIFLDIDFDIILDMLGYLRIMFF